MVENSDDILKINSVADKEVQTLENYADELFLKSKIKKLQQKLRRKQNKINNLELTEGPKVQRLN